MGAEVLRYGDREACYDITETERLSSKIRIHVRPDGTIRVEAPADRSRDLIRVAVQKRARWIFSTLDDAKGARAFALPRDYASGETHFYLGRRYRLRVKSGGDAPSSVKLVGGCIEIILPVIDRAAIRRRLNQWYRARGEDYFRRRLVDIVAGIDWLGNAPSIRLVAMEYQWGSCSPSGTINLNPALIRAPRHCIDYVLTHELCHLREHNHSKRFYALLERHSPHWVAIKAELDGLAELLLRQ